MVTGDRTLAREFFTVNEEFLHLLCLMSTLQLSVFLEIFGTISKFSELEVKWKAPNISF